MIVRLKVTHFLVRNSFEFLYIKVGYYQKVMQILLNLNEFVLLKKIIHLK